MVSAMGPLEIHTLNTSVKNSNQRTGIKLDRYRVIAIEDQVVQGENYSHCIPLELTSLY